MDFFVVNSGRRESECVWIYSCHNLALLLGGPSGRNELKYCPHYVLFHRRNIYRAKNVQGVRVLIFIITIFFSGKRNSSWLKRRTNLCQEKWWIVGCLQWRLLSSERKWKPIGPDAAQGNSRKITLQAISVTEEYFWGTHPWQQHRECLNTSL